MTQAFQSDAETHLLLSNVLLLELLQLISVALEHG